MSWKLKQLDFLLMVFLNKQWHVKEDGVCNTPSSLI
jgi:hypothetical protein